MGFLNSENKYFKFIFKPKQSLQMTNISNNSEIKHLFYFSLLQNIIF